MKKLLKIITFLLLLLVVAAVSVPFVFKDKIKEVVAQIIKENIDAQVGFSDLSVNLFKNFPDASLSLNKFIVLNNAPFEGDTLVYADNFSVKLDLKKNLFKAENQGYNLSGFSIADAVVNIKFNKTGKGNFDIVKKTSTQEEESSQTEETPSTISLNIDEYSIDNLRFTFTDEATNIKAIISELYHKGSGKFAGDELNLNTNTSTKVSVEMDKIRYLKNTPISLDAIIGMDLANQKYTLKDNTLTINKLKLIFEGFVQLLDNGQNINLAFKTPSTSFQNFLDLIPSAYTKSIDGVKTTGNFTVEGKIKGTYSEKNIPTLDIQLLSKDASVKYPSLPKEIKNINIDVKVENKSGEMNDTFVNINNFAFTIDQDHFSAKSKLSNLIKNPKVWTELKGKINLENLKNAYPIDIALDLKGIFNADIIADFDLASIEKEKYENTKISGNASLEKFIYKGEEFLNPFEVKKAALNFNPSQVKLTDFNAKTGRTDLQFSGALDNFYGFLFKKETLKGDFKLTSNLIHAGDFIDNTQISTSSSNENKTQENALSNKEEVTSVKIPAFLDCTFTASAKTVVYDDLNLKNTSGKLIVKDEKVKIENLKTDIFSGITVFSGNISTKNATPMFDMILDMSKLNIAEALKMDMLKEMLPVQNALEGIFNGEIKVKGNLLPDLSPDMNSLTGNMSLAVLSGKIIGENIPTLQAIEKVFPKLKISGKTIKDLKADMTFANGKVNLHPIELPLETAKVTFSGSHGFDQTINYKANFNLPPAMLGGEAEKLLKQVSATDLDKMEPIEVPLTVTGNLDTPKVSVDMKEPLKKLTTQIAKGQATKYAGKATAAVNDVLGNKLGLSTKLDSTNISKEAIKEAATEAVKEKINDEVQKVKEEAKEQAKEAVGNALKGLFGKKKSE